MKQDNSADTQGGTIALNLEEPASPWTVLRDRAFACTVLPLMSAVVAIIALLMSGVPGWITLALALAVGITAGVILGSWAWLTPVILPVAAGWLAVYLSNR